MQRRLRPMRPRLLQRTVGKPAVWNGRRHMPYGTWHAVRSMLLSGIQQAPLFCRSRAQPSAPEYRTCRSDRRGCRRSRAPSQTASPTPARWLARLSREWLVCVVRRLLCGRVGHRTVTPRALPISVWRCGWLAGVRARLCEHALVPVWSVRTRGGGGDGPRRWRWRWRLIDGGDG